MAKKIFVEVDSYNAKQPGDIIQFVKRDGNTCYPSNSFGPPPKLESQGDRIGYDQVVHVTSEYNSQTERSITRVFCLTTVVDVKDILCTLREKKDDND